MSRKKYVIELEDGIYWLMCGNPSTVIALNLTSDKPAEGYIFNETGLGAMTTLEEYEKRETNMTYNEFYEFMKECDKKRRETKMDKTYLSAPWYTLLHEYEALFGEDEDITIKWREDNGDLYIDLMVLSSEKADALSRLLPNEYKLGNNTVYVKVIPANINTPNVYLFAKAFKSNPVVSRVVYKSDATSMFDRHYVVFQNKVVQFFNDEVCDINGNKTLLYEDIARDIFNIQPGIFFCTEGEPK